MARQYDPDFGFGHDVDDFDQFAFVTELAVNFFAVLRAEGGDDYADDTLDAWADLVSRRSRLGGARGPAQWPGLRATVAAMRRPIPPATAVDPRAS